MTIKDIVTKNRNQMAPNFHIAYIKIIKNSIILILSLICPALCIAGDFDIIYENDSIPNKSEIELWLNNYIENWEIKDIHAINNCFSEDPLIITGASVKPNNDKNGVARYKVSNNKQQYLQKVNETFKSKHGDAKIDEVRIENHKENESIFAINIHQNFEQSDRSDLDGNLSEGECGVWTFFIINIKMPKEQQVIYSTVQSDEEYERNGFLTLGDFNIE